MKRGYKRLLVFDIIILILNSFVSSILKQHWVILYFLGILGLFKLLFGFEKDRHRYWKTICIELIIYLLVYYILYYLLGIIITFSKTNHFFNVNTIVKTIIPTIILIIIQEVLRYMMLQKSEGSKLLTVFTCLLFVSFDLQKYFNLEIFSTPYTIFIFIALYLLPSFSKNIFLSYVSYKSGYKPPILYLLITSLYIYFVPIVPNPNEYLYSIIMLVVPLIFLYYIYNFFQKEKDEDIIHKYHQHKMLDLILPLVITAFLVFFTSGFFYYHAIVIGSGSMSPKISKGDVVIVEKKRDFKKLKVGQVIAFKHDNIIVVHRLIKKIEVNGEYFLYTKGDANDFEDDYKITEDMFIGIVNIKIPYIGYPSVWINNL